VNWCGGRGQKEKKKLKDLLGGKYDRSSFPTGGGKKIKEERSVASLGG